jgi:outer membrane protein assembly factor BamB
MTLRLLLPFLAFVGTACFGTDWPQWRGPQRNTITTERINTTWPAEGPRVLWRAHIGTGFASIAVSHGRAYTMGNTNGQDTIWCFDALTGKALWRQTYSAELSPQWYEGGPGATPTVAGGQVFTISKWGDVFCLDAKKGTVIWQRHLRQDGLRPNRWGFAGSPLLWHGLVILNAGSAGTALDRKSGRTVWCTGTNATGYASPTLFRTGRQEEVLIFAARDLVALDPATGRELWRHPWKTEWDTNIIDPLVLDDRIFVSSFTRGCSLLQVRNDKPEVLYDNTNLFNHLSPGVLIDGSLYAFSGEAKKETDLRCLNLLTGELKWTRKEPAFGSLICAGSNVIVLSEKGELMVWSGVGVENPKPETRNPKAREGPEPAQDTPGLICDSDPVARAKILSGTCWTLPALANGLLYARNAKGDLVCVDLRRIEAH